MTLQTCYGELQYLSRFQFGLPRIGSHSQFLANSYNG